MKTERIHAESTREAQMYEQGRGDHFGELQVERDRLKAVNAELVAALRRSLRYVLRERTDNRAVDFIDDEYARLDDLSAFRAAIDKAKGQ